MKPAAFLFDLDGTLIDSEFVWCQAIVDWLADRGEHTTVDEFAPIVIGHSWYDIHSTIHSNFPSLPKTSPMEDSVSLRPYFERISHDAEKFIVPGSIAFLKKVSKIAPCVIVSGSPHADIEAAAKLCGIEGCLKFVLGAEDYTRGKPAPDGYLLAAEMLDVDASECIVIEDSTAGIASGRAAGMHVLGLDRNTRCPQNFCGVEWLVHDLSELNVDVVFETEETTITESMQTMIKNSVQKVGKEVKKMLNEAKKQ